MFVNRDSLRYQKAKGFKTKNRKQVEPKKNGEKDLNYCFYSFSPISAHDATEPFGGAPQRCPYPSGCTTKVLNFIENTKKNLLIIFIQKLVFINYLYFFSSFHV